MKIRPLNGHPTTLLKRPTEMDYGLTRENATRVVDRSLAEVAFLPMKFCCHAFAFIFAISVGLTASMASAAKRPNVLFLIIDDYRVEPIRNSKPITPNLDQLARESVSFNQAYCQMAVCGPSRASVLSGARPDSTGIYFNGTTIRKSRTPNLVTLPQLFKEHGYRSISIGKVFHHEEVETGGDVSKRPGDDALSWSEKPWYHGEPYQQWFEPASAAALAAVKAEESRTGRRIVRGPPYEYSEQPDDVYPDSQIAQKAVETMRRIKDEPFFLAVGFRRPHLPFNCPKKYWDLYPEQPIHLPSNSGAPLEAPEIALHNSYELRSYANMPAEGPIPLEEELNLIRGYRACVTFVDAQVGKVLRELENLDLAGDTIVVLWGDNGYHLGENSLWTKMTNYEAGTHVPLMFRLPDGSNRGQRTNALVELVDIYPTLAELCRLPLPFHLEGTSLLPLLHAPQKAWKQAVFTQFPRGKNKEIVHGHSMRNERYRYTEWKHPNGMIERELYDLAVDPGNTVNIAALPINEALLERLSAQLHAGWQAARPAPEQW